MTNNQNIEELELKFLDYVNWYNNFRIHNSLGSLYPIQFLNKNIA
ncbi:IS3 family transposase [uncultured Tyzzerella sp.]